MSCVCFDSSDVLEDPGTWFFPPLASLITSAGRLLLAMTAFWVSVHRSGIGEPHGLTRTRGFGTYRCHFVPELACLSWEYALP